jgi:predicted Zn finger-like uncharacterized protein
MEVRCERCRAQYAFADDQVGEHGLTVRCSNCGHLFKVKKKTLTVTLPVGPNETGTPVPAADAHRAAAAATRTAPAQAEERRDWSLRQPAGQVYTFRDMSTLHRWIVERKAHREDEISRAGEPWRRLGSIPELQSFFAVVEAAERAAYAPPPQPTMVQYPAPVLPVPGTTPPPALRGRTEVAFPATPQPPRTEVAFPAVPQPPRTEAGFPAAPHPLRTEVAYPAVPKPPPRTDAAFPGNPAPPPRTEIAFPAQPPAPAAPPPGPPHSSLEAIFTPNPVPTVPDVDPFAPRATGQGPQTEQGFPTPPAPAAAPVRSPSAAWEAGAPAAPPAPQGGHEPAWTSADHQTIGGLLEKTAARSAGRKGGSLLALGLLMAAIGGGAVWYYWSYLRTPPLAVNPPEPAPAKVAEAAPAPEPEKRAEAAPRPPETAAEVARPAEKAPEAAPAAEPAKPAEPAPVVARAAEAAPEPAKPAAPPAPAARPAESTAAAKRPAEPKGAKALIAQARRLRDRGRTEQALDLYGKAVALEPKNSEALAGRGWCYLDLSQYGPAEASFETSLEADPKGADALLGLAETYRYAGRRADAVTFYQRYLAAHPKGEDAVAAQNAIQSLKE